VIEEKLKQVKFEDVYNVDNHNVDNLELYIHLNYYKNPIRA
jgi:hypothetical protein